MQWKEDVVAERIGKYVIEKKLGQGGMGIVYKCRDPETGRLAAVKVLPQQLASDAAFLQRFKREVMTLQRMDHPNIVKIYEQGTADSAYYYAMEYAEGVSLETALAKKERMDPLRAIRIIRACAEALQHSHARNIIHRDIKPANIMLLEGEGIKLMDFGIAKVLDATRMTATQGVLGTVEYMSPEQSQGRHVDARTDVYSLGVVLYQCLTTRTPITGTNPTQIIMKLRTHQIESPDEWVPDLPKNLAALVMRMLEKDPAKRLESARELIRELDRIAKQIETGITGRGPATPSGRVITSAHPAPIPTWRNPWVIAVVVLLAAVILWTRRPPPEPAESPPLSPTRRSGQRATSLPKTWLLMARRARARKQYEISSDMCHLIMKHFPDTPQADDAEVELLRIEQDKRHDTEEAERLDEEKTRKGGEDDKPEGEAATTE